MVLTKNQLKAIFGKKSFGQLPEELQGDILDSVGGGGRNTTADDWNDNTIKNRERFLDQFTVQELKELKMTGMTK